MAPTKRLDVVMREEIWVGQTRSGVVVASARTKAQAVRKTADFALSEPESVVVRIHSVWGRVQEERSYP